MTRSLFYAAACTVLALVLLVAASTPVKIASPADQGVAVPTAHPAPAATTDPAFGVLTTGSHPSSLAALKNVLDDPTPYPFAMATPSSQTAITVSPPPGDIIVDTGAWLTDGLDVEELERLGAQQLSRDLWSIPPSAADDLNLPADIPVEPVRYVTTFASDAPTDPGFIQQWALDSPSIHPRPDVRALDAWSSSRGTGVVVAIVDSGVDISHPDLRKNIWTNQDEDCSNGIDDDSNGYVDDCHGWNFIDDSSDVYVSSFDDRHGTHIAGIISADDNSSGVVGLAPDAQIMPLKFISGSQGRTDHAVAGIYYAVDNGADVINLSWGSDEDSRAVNDAIAYALNAGVVVTIAAGNQGVSLNTTPVYPAVSAAPAALVVASHGPSRLMSGFSNYGSAVDLSAPGQSVYSTFPDATYGYLSGTSMAAPYVAAAAALYMAEYPAASSTQVTSAILAATRTEPSHASRTATGGLLDAAAALGFESAPPQLSVTTDTSVVPLGAPVTASATASTPDGTPLAVTWLLPDGSSDVGPSVQYVPLDAGDATLTASATYRGTTVTRNITFTVSATPGDFATSPLRYVDGVYDTSVATTSPPDDTSCVPTGHTLYFDVSALDPPVTFSTSGSDFDTVLVLLDAGGTVVGCADDVVDGVQRYTSLTKSDSSAVLLMAGGFQASAGTLMITATPGISSPAPGIDGPLVVPEGSSATYSTDVPDAVLRVPALSMGGPSPLTVDFTTQGTYRVERLPSIDAPHPDSAITVEVVNAPPSIDNVSVSHVAGSTMITAEVSDPGHDGVLLSASLPGQPPATATAPVTPASLTVELPTTTGYTILLLSDEDGTTVSLALDLRTGSGPSQPGVPDPANPVPTNPDMSLPTLPMLSTYNGMVDLGTGADVAVVVTPDGDATHIYVAGSPAYDDTAGRVNALMVRAITATTGPHPRLVIVQAASPTSVEILAFPVSLSVSAAKLATPTASTAPVPPLMVVAATPISADRIELQGYDSTSYSVRVP